MHLARVSVRLDIFSISIVLSEQISSRTTCKETTFLLLRHCSCILLFVWTFSGVMVNFFGGIRSNVMINR